MLTEHTVAEAVKAAGIDEPPRFVPVTGSTNSDLLGMAELGAPTWTVVVAGHQEGGRGRMGRRWVSEPGASLLASVLLRPPLRASEAPLLSLHAAVAMASACEEACEVDAWCKWPNDLMAGDRKLGGILMEAKVEGGSLLHVIVGVGMNLAQSPDAFPPDLRDIATSVAAEGGRADAGSLLRAFLSALRQPPEPGDPTFGERVLGRYRRLCRTVGREVRAVTARGARVDGMATGIGERGELIVRTASGTERIGFGEVEHLR